MADVYKVGSGQSKDKYVVGQNGKDKYMVGGGGKSVGQANNKSLGSSDVDPVVGSKSAFDYPYNTDSTFKDVGDKSESSMNFGGANSVGIKSNGAVNAGGEVPLVLEEKGDWSAKKDAMSRRKAMAMNESQMSNANGQYDGPPPDIWSWGSKK